jgi:hypothetical protein
MCFVRLFRLLLLVLADLGFLGVIILGQLSLVVIQLQATMTRYMSSTMLEYRKNEFLSELVLLQL